VSCKWLQEANARKQVERKQAQLNKLEASIGKVAAHAAACREQMAVPLESQVRDGDKAALAALQARS
jgi:hypothetical protein